MGKIKRGKGTNLMAMADGSGLPLAANTTSASPHEVTLVGQTLDGKFVAEMPRGSSETGRTTPMGWTKRWRIRV